MYSALSFFRSNGYLKQRIQYDEQINQVDKELM